MLMECGFVKPTSVIKLRDKGDLVRTLCLHHLILKSKAELDQLKEGLHNLRVAAAIESMPDTFWYLFTSNVEESQLTPGIIIIVWYILAVLSFLCCKKYIAKLKQLFGNRVMYSEIEGLREKEELIFRRRDEIGDKEEVIYGGWFDDYIRECYNGILLLHSTAS